MSNDHRDSQETAPSAPSEPPPPPPPPTTTPVTPPPAPQPTPTAAIPGARETHPEGGEDWWKRAFVVAGFTFVNGFVSLRAFSTCLGLSPNDFIAGDYDYFVQGLLYLLWDHQLLASWSVSDLPYAFALLATWTLLWLTLQFSFAWRFRWPMAFPLAMALIAVAVTIVGTHHGRLRAQNLKKLSTFLPPVIVRYHPLGEESSTSTIAGRLVTRNDKVVCLTRVIGWQVADTHFVDPGDTDLRFFVIPMERVESLSVNVD